MLFQKFKSAFAAEIGTAAHEYAAGRIEQKIKLNKQEKNSLLYFILDYGKCSKLPSIPRNAIDIDFIYPTVMAYVNDAIGFRMEPEVVLYYSDNCFGTCDCIGIKDGFLRIHDLKTGSLPAHMDQLYVYSALYCLNHGVKPKDLSFELRIYQGGETIIETPSGTDIYDISQIIVKASKEVDGYFKEGGLPV